MRKLLLVLFVVSLSCERSDTKVIDFDTFDMTVPDTWKKLNLQGLDSYVGGIMTETNDTLIFDLGFYSGDVSENDLPMVYDSIRLSELTKFERVLLPTTNHLIVDSLTLDIDYKRYRKYKVSFDTIDCFRAKIITPVNKRFGASGIYIDELKKSEFDNVRFSFYGFNLRDSVQQKFLEALKSLNFKKYCN